MFSSATADFLGLKLQNTSHIITSHRLNALHTLKRMEDKLECVLLGNEHNILISPISLMEENSLSFLHHSHHMTQLSFLPQSGIFIAQWPLH